jgi:hypothetical protein
VAADSGRDSRARPGESAGATGELVVTKEQIAAFSSLPRSPDNFRMTDPSELTGGARPPGMAFASAHAALPSLTPIRLPRRAHGIAAFEPGQQLRSFTPGEHAADLCRRCRRHQFCAERVTHGERRTGIYAPNRRLHAGLEHRRCFHDDDTDQSAGVAIGQPEVRHATWTPGDLSSEKRLGSLSQPPTGLRTNCDGLDHSRQKSLNRFGARAV